MADSDSLFYLKNQFYLGGGILPLVSLLFLRTIAGAYNAVSQNPVPPKSSPEYLPTLLYTARSFIALNDPARALSLLPADVEPAVRAVRALATYEQAKKSSSDVEAVLDELRDLTIEAEAAAEEVGGEGSGQEGAGVGVVRVAAATAFVKEAELEEALTTLGAGTGVKDLEWYVAISLHSQEYEYGFDAREPKFISHRSNLPFHFTS